MVAIEVKMQSPAKTRPGGVKRPGRRIEREVTTSTRITRSMLKKFKENGGPPVELNPGLDMGVRRRGPRQQTPKRPAQDEGITDSVKQTSAKKRKKSESKAKGKKSEKAKHGNSTPVESRPKEMQPAESQRAEAQPEESKTAEPQPKQSQPGAIRSEQPEATEPQATTSQATTSQATTPQPGEQEQRVSKADVAAAARLAQAAIAAGLTGTTSEAGSPVVEDRPILVRFTKKEMKDLLSEVVVDDGIRQRMEPHWLARTEFLTWWERPAADMDEIKEQVRRMAIRWSKDLQAQPPDDADIPTSTLESWRADLVVVDGPKRDASDHEAENEGTRVTEDKNEDENRQAGEEDSRKEDEAEGEEKQVVKEQGDDKVDGVEGGSYSPGLAELLAEMLTMAMNKMAEWKEAFDKEIAAEPEFRRRRAWTTIVSESQEQATALEEAVRDLQLGTHNHGLSTTAARQAAQSLVVELQHFRIKLEMDRRAFWDEIDEEGAELRLEITQLSGITEEESQDDAQQSETRETEPAVEAEHEPILVAEDKSEVLAENDSDQEETASEPDVEIQAPRQEIGMTDIETRHDLGTGDGSMAEPESGPAESLSEVRNNGGEPISRPAGPEHVSEGNPTEGPLPSEQRDEPAPTRTQPLVESHSITVDTNARRKAEIFAYKTPFGPPMVEEEGELEGSTSAKLEKQDQEPVAEAGEKINDPEPSPRVPTESRRQSPPRQWPGREQASDVTIPAAAASVERQENPFREARLKMAAELYNSATIEEASHDGEHTTDQALVPSDMTGLPTPETISAASGARSASPEIITDAVGNKDDSSSVASNISSLPEVPGSPSSGQSGTAEEAEVEDVVDTAHDTRIVTVSEGTSLLQDRNPSVAVVTTEITEEVGGSIDEKAEDISPSSHIIRMLEDASMPRSIGASIISGPPPSVEETGSEPGETANRTPAPKSPQDTGLAAPGTPSGSELGVADHVGQAVLDGPTTSDAATLPQRGSIGGDIDSPTAMSAGDSPIVLPTLRYIKPQWEDTGSLFSPEEPTYVYSATEAEDGDEDGDGAGYEAGSDDDKETDDVDP